MAAELATGGDVRRGHGAGPRAIGGNPLFLEELRARRRGGRGGRSHRLPASIHEMLLARLDALPEERGACSSSHRWWAWSSERGSSPTWPRRYRHDPDALRDLQRAELVQARGAEPQSAFVFRHRSSTRSPTAASSRARGARSTAASDSGSRSTAARNASPSWRATTRTQRRPRAARRYLRLAGERAHELNASREAFDWFTAAADAQRDEPEMRAQLLEAAPRRSTCSATPTPRPDPERRGAIHEAAGTTAPRRTPASGWAATCGCSATRWRRSAERPAVDGLESPGPSTELAWPTASRQSLMLVPEFDEASMGAQGDRDRGGDPSDQAPWSTPQQPRLLLLGKDDATGIGTSSSRDLALEHHLPDEVGRANTNLASRGSASSRSRTRRWTGTSSRHRVRSAHDPGRDLRPMDSRRAKRVPHDHLGGGRRRSRSSSPWTPTSARSTCAQRP